MTSQQPFVHDRCVVLHAPNQWWSERTGDSTRGIDGIFVGDVRVVGRVLLTVSGADLEWMGNGVDDDDAGRLTHHHVLRLPGGGADPLMSLARTRRVGESVAAESYEVRNASDTDVPLVLEVTLEAEDTPIDAVKGGSAGTPAPLQHQLMADGADVVTRGASSAIRWDVVVPAGGAITVGWSLPLASSGAMGAPAGDRLAAPPADGRLGRLLRRSVADLNGLRMTDAMTPDATFFAAGSPWFFTLFGRDSLIAALLALPFSGMVALGTLRTLATRQGSVHDVSTAEQPGKILHEVRSQDFALDEGHRLPPVYYGSIDATLLWILLLKELVGSGADVSEMTDLRAPLEAACRWLLECGDADDDGLVEYIDESGYGLVNQGWKDSGDSIRRADGSLGPAPVALAEVQGYAHEAALAAADAARALGAEVDGPALHAFAARLRERFQEAFWCADELGAYPALALDGNKRPVDGVASNMGYLLGTGLLTSEQQDTVVARLMDPTMFSGFGIRTLSTTNAAYWPLRYHGGSVWTHDTGQIIWCLLRAGYRTEAQVLAAGLLDAAEDFDFRLPELFAGHARDDIPQALPYPASCRPQAWAAASGVVVWRALTGSAHEIA
ncbi:MAG: glycogen debranching N-terminal domain-containing protein [Arachnia sp.]